MPEEALDDGLTIGARRVDHDIVLVEIAGDLDMHTVPQATAFLTQATATTPRHLILDLSRVTFLGSSGLALLMAAQSGRDGIHGHLHLLGVLGNHPVERPLDLVGLLERFEVASDLDSLLAALGPPRPRRTPG
jgi:anti-sigma B factor antagonist